MKSHLLPLQSLYKNTQLCIIHNDGIVKHDVVLNICSDDIKLMPSERELQKWGYTSLEDAIDDDMIDDIKLGEGYEKQADYLFAKNIVRKINGDS